MVKYLLDEKVLSKDLGIEINFPIRHFDLGGLGVDKIKFINDLAPTFEILPWDQYDVRREQDKILLSHFTPEEILDLDRHDLFEKLTLEEKQAWKKIKPYRKRSLAQFLIEYKSNLYCSIERIAIRSFKQEVSSADYRSSERVFTPMSEFVTDHAEFQQLLKGLGEIVKNVKPSAQKILATAHQVSTVARPGRGGDNAPEGMHQDGADYIVSAIEIEQKGVRGGVSIIWLCGQEKKIRCLSIDLKAGEGIFQADRGTPLWHDVTPIQLIPHATYSKGVRNIFGFDIKVEEK